MSEFEFYNSLSLAERLALLQQREERVKIQEHSLQLREAALQAWQDNKESTAAQSKINELIKMQQEANANLVISSLEKEKLAQQNTEILKALELESLRKDEFLAMLGHELRNPLAPISTAVQILQDHPPDETTFNWALAILDRNVKHITRLVDDLLDVSRIIRGLVDIQRERVELIQLLKDTLESTQTLIQAKQLRVNLDLPPHSIYLEGDPVRLTQIFVNLLTNAAKYNQEGGQITLSARIDGTSVNIVVGDTGQGIEPQLLPHIFELFTQGPQGLDRLQGGLGLGLTLVKKLVDLHGGEISAYSQGANQGSEFVVQLPLLTETSMDREDKKCADLAHKAEQMFRILIIDDNPDVAESVALCLGLMGHHVEIACNGRLGITAAQKFNPDIIILDIGLPDIDGYQVANKIREQTIEQQQILIIALSGYAPTKQETLADDNAGFDHYLIKPPNFNQLMALISEYRPINP